MMKDKKEFEMKIKKKYFIPAALAVLTILFTILIRVVDVKSIGPNDSNVGFSSINKFFFDLFGSKFNEPPYIVSTIVAYSAFGVIGFFGLLGLYQLIKRKSLLKVDKELIALGILYLVVLGTYALFNVVELNYRPVIFDGKLEASFPSSHTLIAIVVFESASLLISRYIKNRKLAIALKISFSAISLTIEITRIIANVHWITDIVGGVLFAATYLTLFWCVITDIRVDEDSSNGDEVQ